jgi:hypothetical protein
MRTKSIRLTEEEEAQLRTYVEVTGEVEATALKRAAMRGLKDMRLEQGILAFLNQQGSSEAAAIAGLPRAVFLQVLIDKGVTILDGSPSMAEQLETLAEVFDDRRFTDLARKLEEKKG